ncbi:serine hydrolase domain-containing protein [Legionella genomosp. 1]|uniref:serine hydrolase domain-containing protein n=1 Tax=Legionella genomosp. 1 TaxID=1093625 RepID=UPI0010552BC8|nr:serine hydrolase domain-containing protein [Legionella genomosp. 1]
MPTPSKDKLKNIAEPAHIPGVSYAYVEPKEGSGHEFSSTSLAVGKTTNAGKDEVDNDTQFPASSLSKIVFTYLVLQLVKDKQIDLDEPLLSIMQRKEQEYERLKVNGAYPEKAMQLTARHVLSHTTGLPNFGSGSDLSSPLSFDDKSVLGKGYSYSGEAFLYLQKVIETKTGKDLETLAHEHVFEPLEMKHSTFLPQPDSRANIVSVHTELGEPTSIYESIPNLRYDLKLMSSLSDLSQSENGKIYLSENPRMYYVKGMSELKPIPPEIDLTNLATKLNNLLFKRNILAITSKAGHTPHLNAAGTLLTTAEDFSKFMTAWLKNMDDPTFQQAFEFETSFALSDLTLEEFKRLSKAESTPKYLKNATDDNYKHVSFSKTEFNDLKRVIDESTQAEIKAFSGKLVPTRIYSITETCGLGWHIYKNTDNKVIAYQYGENLNTRAFMAINVTDKKGAAFFTNSEQGMSIATQILSSPDLAPIGETQALFEKMPQYPQSNEPGWKETLAGKIAEAKAKNRIDIMKTRFYFDKAAKLAPDDESKQRRLEWFDLVQESEQNKKEFTPPLETFAGVYKNPFGEKREIYSKEGALICKEFDREIKLVRISDTDFLPEKNQDFKISIKGEQVTIHFIHSDPKFLFEQSLPESREHSSFFAALSELSDHQPAHGVPVQPTDRVDVPIHETQEMANLESARDLNQRFREAVGNIRCEEVKPSAAEEVLETNSSPSFS